MKRLLTFLTVITLIISMTVSLTLPAGAEEYGNFRYSVSETGEITITEYIGTDAHVVIPETIGGTPVLHIASYVFSGRENMTAVTIPATIRTIGLAAFWNCPNLTEVYISDLAAWCGISFENVFSNPITYAKKFYLNGILAEELVIPDGVTEIKSYAFNACTALTAVSIPNSVKTIEKEAFANCDGLTAFSVPDSVTELGENVFSGCDALATLTIGNGVTEIKPYSFYECPSLKSVAIGNGVTTIGEYAFASCPTLESVALGESVSYIGDYAFAYCSNLPTITFPDSVTYIGGYAFAYCSKLKDVYFGKGEITFGPGPFSYSYEVIFWVELGTPVYKYAVEYGWNYKLLNHTHDFSKGDCFCGMTLTMDNVYLLLKHIDGLDVGLTDEYADINGDGKVSVFDAVKFLQILNTTTMK